MSRLVLFRYIGLLDCSELDSGMLLTITVAPQVTDKALAELVLACPNLLPDKIEGCDQAKGVAFVEAVAKTHPKLRQLDLRESTNVTDESLAMLVEACPQLHPDRLLCMKKGDAYLEAVAKAFPTLKKINLEGCNAVTSAGL